MSTQKKAILILYGLTVAICILNCVREFSAQGQVSGLQVLCTVVWAASFILLFHRYRNEK